MPLTSSFDSPTKEKRNSLKMLENETRNTTEDKSPEKIETEKDKNDIHSFPKMDTKNDQSVRETKSVDCEQPNGDVESSLNLKESKESVKNKIDDKEAIQNLNKTEDKKDISSVKNSDKQEPIEEQKHKGIDSPSELSEEKQDLESSEEEMCIDKDNDSPPRMPPKRGKKRGRSTESTNETPEPKKRVTKSEAVHAESKVSHHSHPNFSVHGIVLTLGEGDVGQLGLGADIMERSRPALVKLDDKIVQVCAGGMHTVCLTNQGKIYTFGCNDESALGRDTSEEGSETLPSKLNLPYKIVQASAGDSHTAVLTEDGHVYAWGNFRDANGSMGLTSGGISKDPLEMLPGHRVVKIVSGGDHLICLTDKGEIFTGGCAEQGQLGRIAECFAGRGGRKGLDSILKMGPVRCKKHSSRKRAEFSDIWAGQYVTFAKEKESGDIYAWGLNNYFQLGFSDMENRFVPERVNSFAEHTKKWVKVQAGQHHTMLLDEEGKVYTLGRAEYGRLGLGENPGERSEPTLVPGLADKKCVDIAAGQSVSFALLEDGTVYGWGMGTSKQLGTGEEEDVWEPVQMAGKQLETRIVVGLSAGGQHTVLLAKDKS